ncbi:ABC transporter substrate-binding protein [Myroides marinus]|uniref:ABC transporter substrate-binding protein n=2 Tax=Myroides marinus TaxID=703342 RepID=A0A161SJD9_9FLAO|nr:ABC transporter substrate-binding protein [Myroides marinus]KUF38313.1 ABC transporter substrate-binding protein [Myroides marinus]KZE81905.1 ABC transporter substrate-binding protein [Myroides marinus]MDM1380091.1 ABC transporter substrate-binding protein [Myroides marinus]MDM1387352.1 ABC transporter substrate-binding protein [Myroides marinus]MDM1389865.1 ABC transporter substrate-binding protein [Myroides marinus]
MRYWKIAVSILLVSQVSFAQTEDRIVIFGQQAVEMVKHFGGKEKVVGVGYLDKKVKKGEYTDWPILTSLWPSVESIIVTRPTQLFGMESAFKAKRSGSTVFWENKGVKVTSVFDFNEVRTLEVFFKDLRTFGRVFNREKEVNQYISEESKKLRELKKKITKSKDGKPKRVLFLANVRSSDIYYCYTQDKCLIGSMLEDFNVEFLTSQNMVIPVSIEYLVSLNPDYIILSSFQANSLSDLLQYFKEHKVLKQLDAVQNNRITTVDYSNAVSGGLEFVSLYQQLVSFLQ